MFGLKSLPFPILKAIKPFGSLSTSSSRIDLTTSSPSLKSSKRSVMMLLVSPFLVMILVSKERSYSSITLSISDLLPASIASRTTLLISSSAALESSFEVLLPLRRDILSLCVSKGFSKGRAGSFSICPSSF